MLLSESDQGAFVSRVDQLCTLYHLYHKALGFSAFSHIEMSKKASPIGYS